MTSVSSSKIPSYFIRKRLHSLLGFWLTLFLMEHLITNSQAALWLGEQGEGFIHAVNFLQRLPYLRVLEIVLLGVPIGFHMIWGIQYALTGKSNAYLNKKSSPHLGHGRNRAYFWQRVSSWILLFGLLFHVAQMRFFSKPQEFLWKNQKFFLTPLRFDEGLYPLSARMKVSLFSEKDLSTLGEKKESLSFLSSQFSSDYNPLIEQEPTQEEIRKQLQDGLSKMQKNPLKQGEVLAVSPNIGTAFLFVVRNTFKSLPMAFFYTLFLLAATFHAFQGIWTFLISWGIILNVYSQKKAVQFCMALMVLFAFLGFMAIWGSYWLA